MNYEFRTAALRVAGAAKVLVILSTATPRGGAYSWNDEAGSSCHPKGLCGVDRTRRSVANDDDSEGQAGSSPLQWAERLCSGKLPACHYPVPGRFVILSERSESKNPPRFGAKLSSERRYRPLGGPSTRSSDSLAQGDMRVGVLFDTHPKNRRGAIVVRASRPQEVEEGMS